MNWKLDDKLRVLNARAIAGGVVLNVGEIYEVIAIDHDGLPVISLHGDNDFYFVNREMQFVERISKEGATAYGFIVTCSKCGSEDCSVEAKLNHKNTIDIEIICLDCGQVA